MVTLHELADCLRSRRKTGEDAEGHARKAASAAEHVAAATHQLPRESDAGRTMRRRWPISAYIGANGSGKTLCMVHDTLPSLYQGRKIFSTVPITWPDGTTPDNVAVLHDWQQILDAEHADILLDEVSSIASSRESESLPPQIATMLQQLRKRDLVLRWTAPSWSRADKILRETTKTVTICHGFFAKIDPDSQWRRNTLFRFQSFDAGDYTEITINDAQRKFDCLASKWFLLSRHIAPCCYNTFASVSTIGTVLMSGRCAVCGGRRRVPECSCEDYKALTSRSRSKKCDNVCSTPKEE